MALHDLSAFDHIDRIESMVYDALYSDRRPPDPSLVPTPPPSVEVADGSDQNANRSLAPQQRRKQPDATAGGLSFVDGN